MPRAIVPRQPPEFSYELEEPNSDLGIRDKVYHLRVGGMSFARIAALMHITVTRAANYYQEYLGELAKFAPTGDDRQGEISLELTRLDRIQEAFWPDAIDEHKPDIMAARMILEVMKHRAKLKGWDSYDPQDAVHLHRVLVIGNNADAFLEALEAGRAPALASGPRDNDSEGVVEGEVDQ